VNENQAGQVISRFLLRQGALLIAHRSFFVSLVLRRARTDLIGPSICAPTTPKFSTRKKSLAAGWGVNQGTKDLPLPINHLLPSLHHLLPLHILHGTFYYNTSHLRFVALHPFPPSNHLRRSHSVGICQHGKHRQRYIQSRCTNASALVVGTHSLARGQHTQWTVGRRETSSRRVGTVGLSKNQLRKRFDLRA
jgi:hypothetical protein